MQIKLLDEIFSDGKGLPEYAIASPDTEVAEGEKVLVVLEDEDLRRLYSLQRVYAARVIELAASAESPLQSPEARFALRKEAGKAGIQADLVGKLFWAAIKEKYDLLGISSIGIRKGWNLVERPSEGPDRLEGLLRGFGC